MQNCQTLFILLSQYFTVIIFLIDATIDRYNVRLQQSAAEQGIKYKNERLNIIIFRLPVAYCPETVQIKLGFCFQCALHSSFTLSPKFKSYLLRLYKNDGKIILMAS